MVEDDFRNENWRRGGDSNPRYPLRYVRFRGGSFQPLTHLSAWNRPDCTIQVLRLRSGFRQRARTPANRLNFRGGSLGRLGTSTTHAPLRIGQNSSCENRGRSLADKTYLRSRKNPRINSAQRSASTPPRTSIL
jgi:hypothetical protein